MVTPEAVFACHDNQLFYLGSVEQDDGVKELIRSVSDEELQAHELSYRPQRQRRGPALCLWQRVELINYVWERRYES